MIIYCVKKVFHLFHLSYTHVKQNTAICHCERSAAIANMASLRLPRSFLARNDIRRLLRLYLQHYTAAARVYMRVDTDLHQEVARIGLVLVNT